MRASGFEAVSAQYEVTLLSKYQLCQGRRLDPMPSRFSIKPANAGAARRFLPLDSSHHLENDKMLMRVDLTVLTTVAAEAE